MVMGSNRIEIIVTAKDQASRELNKVSSTAGKIGGKLKGLAKGPLPAVAAAAAVAGLTASVKMAAGFEKGMGEVRTLLPDITDEAFGKMNKDVLKFSKTMGVDLADATKGLYNAISAGVPRENVMEFMTQAAKTSSGGVTDLETSVGALAGVMNVYGDSVGGAQEVSDILFTTVKGGMTTMPELANAIGRVLPTAAAMGVNFKDISADLAVMTAQTGDTNASVTRLNGLLVEAGRTGTKLSDAISEKLGSSFRELIAEGKSTGEIFEELRSTMPEQEFTDLFGSVEAMNAALQITGTNSDKVTEQLGNMEAATGATQKAFDTMENTASDQMEDAMNSMKISMTEVGLKVLPLVAKAMDGLARGISKGMELLPKLIKKIQPLKPVFKIIFGMVKTGFEVWVEVIKLVFKGIGALITLIKKIAPNLAGPFELIKKGLRLYLDVIEKIEAIGNKLTGGLFGKIFSKVVGVTPGVVAARAILGDDQVWDKEKKAMADSMAFSGLGLGNLSRHMGDIGKGIDAGSFIPKLEADRKRYKTTGISAGISGMNDALGLNLLVKANEEQKKAKAKEIEAMKEAVKEGSKEGIEDGYAEGLRAEERRKTEIRANEIQNAMVAAGVIGGFNVSQLDAGTQWGNDFNAQMESNLLDMHGMVKIRGGNLGLGGSGLDRLVGGISRTGVQEVAEGVFYNVTVEGNVFASDESGRAIVEAIDAYAVSQGQTPAEVLNAQNATP